MWPATGGPNGTFYFDNQPNVLDQVLVNKNMARETSPVRAPPGTVEILRYEDTSTGCYQRPAPPAAWAARR